MLNTLLKKLIILISLTMLGVINVKAQPLVGFGGGDGITEATAYQIYSKAHLEYLGNRTSVVIATPPTNWTYMKYFKIMDDITDSIGSIIGSNLNFFSSYNIAAFQGYLDGNNKKITLNINNYLFIYTKIDGSKDTTKLSHAGLFPIMYKARITNVITDGYIINNVWDDDISYRWLGIVGRFCSGEVHNCTNLADYITNSVCVGGIVGHADTNAIITNCSNYGNIEAYSFVSQISAVGGIVGHIDFNPERQNCKVSNCINQGTISGNDAVGGIVGMLGTSPYVNISSVNNTEIIRALNIGNVIGNNYVAGIIGINNSQSVVEECINSGYIKGNNNVSGISFNSIDSYPIIDPYPIITNSINTGVVECENDDGDIYGIAP